MPDLKSLMTSDPATCREDTPIQQVAQLMVKNDCGQIPVVDAAHKPIGVVTDRDIAVRVVATGKDLKTATAADAITRPCRSISTAMSTKDAVKLMENEQIRRVPVVDESGKLVGIVAIADLAREAGSETTARVVQQVSKE